MAVQENQKRKKAITRPVSRATTRAVTRGGTSRSQAPTSKPRKAKVTNISSGKPAAKVVPLRKEYRSIPPAVSVPTSYNARVLSVIFFLVGAGVCFALGSFIYEEWSASLLGSNLFGRVGHLVASTLFELFGYSALLVCLFCFAYGNFYWGWNSHESGAYNSDVNASQSQVVSTRGGKVTLFLRHIVGSFGILAMFAVAVSALWSLSGAFLVRVLDIPGIPVEVVGGSIGFWMYDAFVEPLNVMGILVMSLVTQVLIWNVFFSYSLERQFSLFGSLFSLALTTCSKMLRGVRNTFRSFSVILWNGGRGTTSVSITLLRAGISALKWLLRVLGFFPLLFYRATKAVASFVVALMVPHSRQERAAGEGSKSQTGAVIGQRGAADLVERPRAEIARTVNIISSQPQPGNKGGDSSNAEASAKQAANPITTGGFLGLGKKEKKGDASPSGASAGSGKRTSGNYTLPSLDLLTPSHTTGNGKSDGQSNDQYDRDELIRNCQSLEKALLDFKIGGTIVEVQPGPVITLYQFEPAPGIKVQRIISLADDLALALKVTTVRVYAPVPGKGTVGIEVPNAKREIVRLRDVLASAEMSNSKTRLLLALGKDTFGEPVTADLSKMPHLLIAGATGTGKSVCINSLLLSLLYRNTPRDLRLLLIDPKMLELSVYEGIPHLKCQVITNPKRARGVLWWAVEEMERRYNLMKDLGVRNLASYNKAVANGGALTGEDDEQGTSCSADGESGCDDGDIKILGGAARFTGHSHLPRIVVVVDEMADLMLTVGKEIEELLTRLAQKARASGIHLILATQRPSVNVITGLIKANFPTRISFQVASRIDSRTVLDSSGSERLLGMGDMLFMTPGIGRLKRMHSPFVSDAEVQQVASAWTSQGAPDYDPEIDEILRRLEESEKGTSGGALFDDEVDSLYDQAVNVVMEKGVASTSLIQRVFRIGYNRAARILEMMEKEGVVGPADGAKPRQVFHNGV